jgi:hypothetical protein
VKIVLLVAVLAPTLFAFVATVLGRLWHDRRGRPGEGGAGPPECGPGVNQLQVRSGSDPRLADRPAPPRRIGGPDRVRRLRRPDAGSRRRAGEWGRHNRFGGWN